MKTIKSFFAVFVAMAILLLLATAAAGQGVSSLDSAQSVDFDWSVEYPRVLRYLFGSIAGVVALVLFIKFLVVFPIRRFKARRYVLENKGTVAIQLAKAEKEAEKSGVKNEIREALANLRSELNPIDRLNAISGGINWIEKCEKLESIKEKLCFLRQNQA